MVPEHHERPGIDERVGELDVLGPRLRVVLDAPVEGDHDGVGARRGRADLLDDAPAIEERGLLARRRPRLPAAGRRSPRR